MAIDNRGDIEAIAAKSNVCLIKLFLLYLSLIHI